MISAKIIQNTSFDVSEPLLCCRILARLTDKASVVS